MTASSDIDSSERLAGSNRLGLTGKWRLLLLLPLLLAPAVWMAQRGGNTVEVIESPQILPVETMRLQAVDSYATSRVYTGEMVARRSSDLGFERSGTVIELLADEGDIVAAGEPLARLDTRDLAAQRQQLEAEKRRVQAQLQELETGPRAEDIAAAEGAVSDLNNQLSLAQLQANRRAELYAKGAISREELDEKTFGARAIADRLQQAQSQLEELRNGTRSEQLAAQVAQVDQIDARIEAIDVSLDKSVLLAPFAGKVSARAVDEGTVVSGAQLVMKLVENGAMEARIGVPEQMAQRLVVGDRQSIQVSTRTYPAVVTARLPEVDEVSQTVTVVLEVAADEDLTNNLTIGATARMPMAEQQSASGYWLPSTALIAGERGLWSVYALVKDEGADAYRVARRDVEVLHTESDQTDAQTAGSSESRAFVRGLVAQGDRIVTSGTHRVVAGQLVTPTDRPSDLSSEAAQ